MIEMLRLLIWLTVTLLSGWGALSLIFYKESVLFFGERLALSYCLGLGIISIEMAIFSAFGIRFSTWSIAGWMSPLILAALFIRQRPTQDRSYKNAVKKGGRLSALEGFFMFFIFSQAAYAFFTALVKPLEAYDAVAIYAIKSKIFYLSKCIPQNFFKDFASFVPHIEYPLLLPLAETCFYTFFGSLNDLMVKIMFPLYYTAILTVFYFTARRSLERKSALLFTFLLSTIPLAMEHAAMGYADLSLAFYYSASFFYLILWMREKRGPYLVLSFALSALGVWTKTEGLMLVMINLLLTGIFILRDGKDVFGKGAAYIAISSAGIALYMYARRMAGMPIHSDFGNAGLSQTVSSMSDLKNIASILYQYARQFFVFKKWNIVWVVFLTLLIVKRKNIFSTNIKYITMAILFIMTGYVAVYLSLPGGSIAGHLPLTLDRFFIHFFPIVVLWTAYIFMESGLDL